MRSTTINLSAPKAVFLLAFLLAAPLPASAFTIGSGFAKTETRPAGTFSKISISGSLVLEVVVGQPLASVTVSGDDNVVPQVETSVSDDVLHINFDENLFASQRLVVKVAMPKLSAISASGANKINVSNLAGERFDLVSNGSVNATLTGNVDQFTARLRGAGRVAVFGLESHGVEISILGAGRADVNARDVLDVSILGAGKVEYMGKPAVKRSMVAIGAVQARRQN
jgi:hypothetical protein